MGYFNRLIKKRFSKSHSGSVVRSAAIQTEGRGFTPRRANDFLKNTRGILQNSFAKLHFESTISFMVNYVKHCTETCASNSIVCEIPSRIRSAWEVQPKHSHSEKRPVPNSGTCKGWDE